MKKIFRFVFIVLLIFPIVAKADCSSSEKNEKRHLANNIKWAVEYYFENKKPYFNIIITNIFDDLYITSNLLKDSYDSTHDTYTIRAVEANQKLVFNVYSKLCGEKEIVASKNLVLPAFNNYYYHDYCEGINEFYACNRWRIVNITEAELKKLTYEYRESLINADFIEPIIYETSNWTFYAIILLALVILVMILVSIIYGKREKNFI